MAIIDDLVSYYKLDEAAGNAIDAHGSNDGTLDSVTQNSNGIINTGYLFDGATGSIDVTGVTTTGSNSVNGWIKTTSAVGPERVFDSQTGRYIVQVENGVVSYFDGTGFGTGTTATVNDDVYNMITVTNDGTANKIYINGVLDVDEARTANTIGGDCAIGSTFDNTSNSVITGNLDEIGFWDKELQQSEITALYNSGAGLAYPFTTPPTPTPDYPVVSDPATSGQKELNRKWPVEDGDELGTTKTWDRKSSLEPQGIHGQKTAIPSGSKDGI